MGPGGSAFGTRGSALGVRNSQFESCWAVGEMKSAVLVFTKCSASCKTAIILGARGAPPPLAGASGLADSPSAPAAGAPTVLVFTRCSASCRTAIIPNPSKSTLIRPMSAQSSLSHWMTTRSGMLAFSSGTISSSRPLQRTIPPEC
jgi:hypothetical protein